MFTEGVSHRDIKPENILIDSDFNLKFMDFGFAAPVKGRSGDGYLKTQCGTVAYMAPEIIEKRPYQGHNVDLFAVAIILFIFYTGHPCFFQSASKDDPFYSLIYNNQSPQFWQHHSNNKPEGFFEEEFKDLLTNMF